MKSMNKPNFQKMTLNELRHYVVKHREDEEAWREYASRPRPNAITIPADVPEEEAAKILKELLGKTQ